MFFDPNLWFDRIYFIALLLFKMKKHQPFQSFSRVVPGQFRFNSISSVLCCMRFLKKHGPVIICTGVFVDHAMKALGTGSALNWPQGHATWGETWNIMKLYWSLQKYQHDPTWGVYLFRIFLICALSHPCLDCMFLSRSQLGCCKAQLVNLQNQIEFMVKRQKWKLETWGPLKRQFGSVTCAN